MGKTANSEWRIANGEWEERRLANSEWRMVLVRVGAGSQPALPQHGEAVGEDSKPGRCNRLESVGAQRGGAAPCRLHHSDGAS
jgi:hypothetical protein